MKKPPEPAVIYDLAAERKRLRHTPKTMSSAESDAFRDNSLELMVEKAIKMHSDVLRTMHPQFWAPYLQTCFKGDVMDLELIERVVQRVVKGENRP